jgi:DUF971 family protein
MDPTAAPTANEISTQPVEVRRLPEERRLAILWSDGARTVYDYSLLRGYCPCAGCQGHLVREMVYQPPRTAVDLFLIEPVGNYALSFLFSDGHHTGIYRFEFLRTLEQREQRRLARLAATEAPGESNAPG